MSIVEFLEARIAEDEANARQAVETDDDLTEAERLAYFEQDLDAGALYWHSKRMLAEGVAKRWVLETLRMYEPADEWYVHPDMGTRGNNAAGAVRAMAAIYAEYPDYRQEWAL